MGRFMTGMSHFGRAKSRHGMPSTFCSKRMRLDRRSAAQPISQPQVALRTKTYIPSGSGAEAATAFGRDFGGPEINNFDQGCTIRPTRPGPIPSRAWILGSAQPMPPAGDRDEREEQVARN